MKRVLLSSIIVFGFLAISHSANAQTSGTSQTRDTTVKARPVQVVVYKKANRFNSTQQTHQGAVFSGEDLSRMANRNINKIANTVGGVNSHGGGVPSIKGASPAGTAYFIDGIRVYSFAFLP